MPSDPLLRLGTVSYGHKHEGGESGLRLHENSPAKRGVGGLPLRLPIYLWTITGVNIRGMTRSGESPEEKPKTWRKKTKPKEDNSFENPKPRLPALSFYYFYILIIQSSEILLAGRWWLLIYHFNSTEVSLYLIGGISEISDLFSGAKQNKTKQTKISKHFNISRSQTSFVSLLISEPSECWLLFQTHFFLSSPVTPGGFTIIRIRVRHVSDSHSVVSNSLRPHRL